MGHSWRKLVDEAGDPVVDPTTGRQKRERKHCGNAARKGAVVCGSHGGEAAQVAAAADRRMEGAHAVRAAATYGLPIDTDPGDALMAELARTAGHVHWLGQLVASLEHHDDPHPTVLGDGGEREPDGPHVTRSGLKQYTRTEKFTVEQPSVWVQLYQQERKHLTAVATALLRAGVEERQVKIVEQQAEQLADAMRRLVEALGLDPAEERVRTAMRASLTLVPAA